MAATVSMHNPETAQKADVHPDEVENMKGHGWRVSEAAPLPPPPEVKPKLTLPKKD